MKYHYTIDQIEEMIKHIDTYGKGLTKWEVKFISNLVDNQRWEYSDKQIENIIRIYDNKCG